jgi:cytochrome c biogenesis protein CcmG, thiol:disulfide interchange protein DsbE
VRRVALLLAGLALLAGCGSASSPAAKAEDLSPLRASARLGPCPRAVSAELPALRLPCLSGGPDVDVAAGGPGVPTVVNMWATWCGPCVRETPLLVDLAARAGDRVALLGVATETEPRLALLFNRDLSVHYPSVVDADGALFRRYAGGLPVTLFVDASGRVVGRQVGEIKTRAQLDGLVARYLGVRL